MNDGKNKKFLFFCKLYFFTTISFSVFSWVQTVSFSPKMLFLFVTLKIYFNVPFLVKLKLQLWIDKFKRIRNIRKSKVFNVCKVVGIWNSFHNFASIFNVHFHVSDFGGGEDIIETMLPHEVKGDNSETFFYFIVQISASPYSS